MKEHVLGESVGTISLKFIESGGKREILSICLSLRIARAFACDFQGVAKHRNLFPVARFG